MIHNICIWLLSLSIVFFNFISTVTYISSLVFQSLDSISLYEYNVFVVHSSVGKHLDFFQLWAIKYNVIMSIHLQTFVWIHI